MTDTELNRDDASPAKSEPKSTIHTTDAVAVLLMVVGALGAIVAAGVQFGVWYGVLTLGILMFLVGVLLAAGSGDTT